MNAVDAMLSFREVTPDFWPDLERLFEAPGGPKYCWCMVWRPMPSEERRLGRPAKKAAMEGLVLSGESVGILGFADEQPVAWCSIAPRPTYRSLGGLQNPDEPPGSVWSLVCMYVPRRMRGQGLARRLVSAAIEQARSRGASVVEAYPVDPESPSYKYMGVMPTFERLGFEEVARAGKRRHVMRLRL